MSRPEAIELVKRATRMTVQTGLFAGMKMTPLQSWGGGEDIAPSCSAPTSRSCTPP